MKKTLLCSLFLLCGSALLWAASPPQKIEVNESTPGRDNGRSLTLTPNVTYHGNQSMLEVRFYSEQRYVLTVVDATGAAVFITQLVTDGGNHSYMLPALQAGHYSLTIESPTKTYIGSILVR